MKMSFDIVQSETGTAERRIAQYDIMWMDLEPNFEKKRTFLPHAHDAQLGKKTSVRFFLYSRHFDYTILGVSIKQIKGQIRIMEFILFINPFR